MKPLASTLCAPFLAALVLTGCASNKADWEIVGKCDIPVSDQSYIAGFLDGSYGISAGLDGGIAYSVDGGQTWIKGQNQSQCRFCLDIVDRDLAWAGGNGADVRVTKDGGKTWEAVSDCQLGSVHISIDFLDGTT